MIKWTKIMFEGHCFGYVSADGRFKVQRLYLKSSSQILGYPWRCDDLHEKTQNFCKTMADAKRQAETWACRMSRKQMEPKAAG